MNARPHPASTASALGLALLVGGCRTAAPHEPPSAAALAAARVDVKTPPGEANEWNHGPDRFHADHQAIAQSYFILAGSELHRLVGR